MSLQPLCLFLMSVSMGDPDFVGKRVASDPVTFQIAPEFFVIPEKLSLAEIERLITTQKPKPGFIGCGEGFWNGEWWGVSDRSYFSFKVPWINDPVPVAVTSIYRQESYVVEFTGPGFKFRRRDLKSDQLYRVR